MKKLKFGFFGLLFAAMTYGCGNNNTPLDADTRSMIDSIANHRISVAQKSNDSLCKVAQNTVLPQLVDSIKKERLREIEAQLKSIPK